MRPALFLDRDGVINVDKGYVHRPEDCEFVPGIFEFVRRANGVGLPVFVVTNQAGIARGYYSEEQFLRFTDWMLARFRESGASIQKVYHCPHHPDFGLFPFRKNCRCRKPEPGMLLAARDEFGLDMTASLMIGDALSDMQAAAAAGVGRRLLLSADAECVAADAGATPVEFTRFRSLDEVGFDNR